VEASVDKETVAPDHQRNNRAATSDAASAARRYIARHWAPIPVPLGNKAPVLRGWQALRLTNDDVDKHFSVPSNVGVLNGCPSAGLTDVDLDAPEAVAIADAFLPQTGLIFGRAGKPRSHWEYVVADDVRITKYTDIDGTTLLELRGTGGHTLWPPSINPSGEAVRFDEDGEPLTVEVGVLRAAVARLAAASLIARHWPRVNGNRHSIALALAGHLLSCGLDVDTGQAIIRAAATVAGDQEVAGRLADVASTAKRIGNGERVTAGPTLGQLLGDEVPRKLAEWLGARTAALSIRSDVGPRRLILLPASEVRPEKATCAWEGRVPLGAVSLLVGQPGLGKSTIAVDTAARLSRGELPGDLLGIPVPVLLATAEDAVAQVVVPRLIAAGANRRLIHIVSVRQGATETGLVLPNDIPALRNEMAAIGARAVIIDPLIAHLPSEVDGHRDQHVRRVLAPLTRAAEETGATVLAVMHLNKAANANPLTRVGGSIGFVAAARSVLLLGKDPKDDTGQALVLAHVKANFAPLAPSLRLHVEPRTVETGGATIPTSGIDWRGEAADVRAADLLVDRPPQDSSALGEAKEAISEILSNGGVPAAHAEHELKRLGISVRTWKRAKAQLGVRSVKKGYVWHWERSEECHSTLAPFDTASRGQNVLASAKECQAQMTPFEAEEADEEMDPGVGSGPPDGDEDFGRPCDGPFWDD
jgi:hypothetical protein